MSRSVRLLFYCLSSALALQAFLPIAIAQSDSDLVVVTNHTELTDQVLSQVNSGLALLPPELKQRFIAFGVTVVITPTLAQLVDTAGGSEYDTRKKRVIICERTADGTNSDLRRMNITTLHELGHAYDHLLGYPSRASEFRAAYEKDAPNVPERDRGILSHFLQSGNKGPSECFASLFACKYFHGVDRRLNALKDDFPAAFDIMQRY